MIVLILAGGYATRLAPLSDKIPKALLPINGKAILDYYLDELESHSVIKKIVIATNQKHYHLFETYIKQIKSTKIILHSDGSTSKEKQLPILHNLMLMLNEYKFSDDLLIMAGDNLLDFSISKFIGFFLKNRLSCSMRYFEEDLKSLSKTGVVITNNDDVVITMKEKPQKFISNYAVPPFYIFAKNDLDELRNSINLKLTSDSLGTILEMFCNCHKMLSYLMPGKRYDIGTIDSYYNAINTFKKTK